MYRKQLDDTFSRLKFSQATKSEILKFQTKLGQKKTYRRWIELKKERIINKLFYSCKKTLLQCIAVSEIMKRYVLLFQQNGPAIFRLFPGQLVLFGEFVLYFARPEIFDKHRTIKLLMSINFEDSSNHLPPKMLVVGIGASKIIKKATSKTTASWISFWIKHYWLIPFVQSSWQVISH